MTDQATTFMLPLAGRDIVFRYPLPGQMIILRRRYLRAQEKAKTIADQSTIAAMSSQLIVDCLDVVDSLIVNPDDAAFLEKAMLEGKLSHEDAVNILRLGREAEQASAKPVKKATKKAAAAKTVANRGRTKR